MSEREIDLRAAMNAISDVVQNRPRPLREFDQIYMKAGDMVLQSEFVAKQADGKTLAFIGDGDAISVCAAYLKAREIIDYGPTRVTVFDFDERIVGAINRFAEKEGVGQLDARIYNCADALPKDLLKYDIFYTNPPWGQYNNGASVKLFVQRGFEIIHHKGDGIVVIADDAELAWTRQVLGEVQRFAFERGFFVNKMMPQLHAYHLDDAAELKSCNLLLKSISDVEGSSESLAITDTNELENFYGRQRPLLIKYVKEKKRLDYGKANSDEYYLEPL